MWRQYQIQNINNVAEFDKQLAEDEFQTSKRILHEQMVDALEEKLKRLEEEKTNMSVADASESRVMTRKLRSRTAQKSLDAPMAASSSYRRKTNPPQINYSLRDKEVFEDLQMIQTRRPGR